jgi:hypothetical protein
MFVIVHDSGRTGMTRYRVDPEPFDDEHRARRCAEVQQTLADGDPDRRGERYEVHELRKVG